MAVVTLNEAQPKDLLKKEPVESAVTVTATSVRSILLHFMNYSQFNLCVLV